MTPCLSRIAHFYEGWPVTVSFASAALVLIIDFFTGRHLEFPIAYAIPVGLAAWKRKPHFSVFFAFVLPLIRIAFHIPWHELQNLAVAVMNAFINIVSLFLYSILISNSAQNKRSLEKKVKVLEGILPICASCRRIRDENGQYIQIEGYISEHSNASFSHGICPECARKLYPDFIDIAQTKNANIKNGNRH